MAPPPEPDARRLPWPMLIAAIIIGTAMVGMLIAGVVIMRS